MANDEMDHIRNLDLSMLGTYSDQTWLYFAVEDDWVGEQKAQILHSSNLDFTKIAHGQPDIPHAFCISERRCSLSSFGAELARSWGTGCSTMPSVA